MDLKSGMSNFSFTTENVKKTLKQKASEKLFEKFRLKDILKELEENLIPSAMEKMSSALDSLIETVESKIEEEFEKEFGMTLQKANALCSKGMSFLEKIKKIDLNKKLSDEEKTKRLNEVNQKLNDWLDKQSDEIYSIYSSLAIKKTISDISDGIASFEDSESEKFKSLVSELKIIQEMFKSDNDNEKEENVSATKSEIDEDDTYIQEFQKSSKSERGSSIKTSSDGKTKKKRNLNNFVKSLMKIVSQIEVMLPLLQILISNYQTNKKNLKDDADSFSGTLSKNLGFGKSWQIEKDEPEDDNVPNKIKYDKGTQLEEIESDKDLFPSLKNSFRQIETVEENEEEIVLNLFSELDRVDLQLNNCSKNCRFNPDNPLESISTKENGGLLKNLENAGETRKELSESILDINNGERL